MIKKGNMMREVTKLETYPFKINGKNIENIFNMAGMFSSKDHASLGNKLIEILEFVFD